MELNNWRREEEKKFEEAKLAQEAALALAEKEKARSKAALETAEAAKKIAANELEIVNRGREQHARREWELNNAFSRLRLEPRRGRNPTFKFTAKLGKLERKGNDGVDWYRYQKV